MDTFGHKRVRDAQADAAIAAQHQCTLAGDA
jgi:hypothetical protein